jgi:hypothetical protein
MSQNSKVHWINNRENRSYQVIKVCFKLYKSQTFRNTRSYRLLIIFVYCCPPSPPQTLYCFVQFQILRGCWISNVGRDSSVGITTELSAGRSGDRIPVGAIFSLPVQTGPGAHPASQTVYRVFPGHKAAWAWRWHPAPSSAEFKVRLELYLYSPYGPSWPVSGWTLPLPLLK